MAATRVTASLLQGATEVEQTARGVRPHRLPGWVRQQFPDPQLMTVEAQTSGVRLAFTTQARRIELVLHPLRLAYKQAERPRGVLELTVDGELVASDELTGGDAIEADLQTGATQFVRGSAHTAVFASLAAGEKLVEIWLPHNESAELVELRTDQPVEPAQPTGPVWVHHGSSISHGSNAAGPTQTWPAVAARLGGVRLQNLGLGGSAMIDPFLARVVRDAPADVISLKLGINVVNADAMRLRALVPAVHGFLDTVRDGHPHTPLLLVSPIFCGIHEDTPGPGALVPESLGTAQPRFRATGRPEDVRQGALTLRVIREALAGIVEQRAKEDPNLHHLDGLELYGPADALRHPLPDELHPDTVTHRIIGERFAAHAFDVGGVLKV